jgi:hypothetical protein
MALTPRTDPVGFAAPSYRDAEGRFTEAKRRLAYIRTAHNLGRPRPSFFLILPSKIFLSFFIPIFISQQSQ